MCGIICAINTGKNALPVNDSVIMQFEDQQNRGTNGFGIIKVLEDGTYKVDRATEGCKFMWDLHSDKVTKMIVHHRYPTSSANKIKQTHPMLVDNGSLKYKYYVVHNGVISNDDEVKKIHEDLGFVYETNDGTKFNDSECLAIDVARFIEGQINITDSIGSVAFVCIQVDKKTNKAIKLFFGRNTNPLNMAKTRGKLFLSSEGQGDPIEPFVLYECKLDEEMKLSKRPMKFAEAAPAAISGAVKDYWGDKNKKTYRDNNYGGINLFNDEAEKRYYRNLSQSTSDVPDDNEEQSPFEESMEKAANEIQEEVDSFLDLLYRGDTVKYVSQDDIEITMDNIRLTMEKALADAQTAHMEVALAADGLSVNGA